MVRAITLEMVRLHCQGAPSLLPCLQHCAAVFTLLSERAGLAPGLSPCVPGGFDPPIGRRHPSAILPG